MLKRRERRGRESLIKKESERKRERRSLHDKLRKIIDHKITKHEGEELNQWQSFLRFRKILQINQRD